MKTGVLLCGVALAVVTGCATGVNVPMSGTTVAQGKLKADVFRMLPAYAAAATGCTEPIERVHTEIVEAPETVEVDKDGRVRQGRVRERWVVTLCGRGTPFLVTFTPDGKGGSFVSLSREQ